MIRRLPECIAAVDDERGPSHVARRFAGEVYRQRADLFRFTESSDWNLRREVRDEFRPFSLPASIRVREKSSRRDRVYRDALGRPVRGDRLGKADDAALAVS